MRLLLPEKPKLMRSEGLKTFELGLPFSKLLTKMFTLQKLFVQVAMTLTEENFKFWSVFVGFFSTHMKLYNVPIKSREEWKNPIFQSPEFSAQDIEHQNWHFENLETLVSIFILSPFGLFSSKLTFTSLCDFLSWNSCLCVVKLRGLETRFWLASKQRKVFQKLFGKIRPHPPILYFFAEMFLLSRFIHLLSVKKKCFKVLTDTLKFVFESRWGCEDSK